jgi:hypothetical protein
MDRAAYDEYDTTPCHQAEAEADVRPVVTPPEMEYAVGKRRESVMPAATNSTKMKLAFVCF